MGDLGLWAQSQCVLDKDVAVADQQDARRPIAAEDGPGRVVQGQTVCLVQRGLKRVSGRRQGVPLGVGGAAAVDRQRTCVEALAVDPQDQGRRRRLWAVIDDARQCADLAVTDARAEARDGQVGRIGRADRDVADGVGKRGRRLGGIEAPVAGRPMTIWYPVARRRPGATVLAGRA